MKQKLANFRCVPWMSRLVEGRFFSVNINLNDEPTKKGQGENI